MCGVWAEADGSSRGRQVEERGELTTRELTQHWRAERRERTRHTGKKKGKEQHDNENEGDE